MSPIRLRMVVVPLGCLLLVLSSFGQKKEVDPINQVKLRFTQVPAYKGGVAVQLKSVLLKKKVVPGKDGRGSLAAILLLTNQEGFGCQSDPDAALKSDAGFIVGISLYEPFQAPPGPEKTVLYQMLFATPKPTQPESPTVFKWQEDAAVLFRAATAPGQWYTLKKGRPENGLAILNRNGETVLVLDYADDTLTLSGEVSPVRCP